MASDSFCDPCSEAKKSLTATKYCFDCEERLCTDCAELHCRFKAFKSHHVIDMSMMSSIGSNFLMYAKKSCNVHSELLLDYYCTDHEFVCIRACISNEHRVCQNVTYLITTLNALNDNRQSNLQSIEKSKSAITKQIRAVKSKLLKQIDELERELTTIFSSLQRKHEMEINKQKHEISQVLVNVIENKNEMDFLRDHGSNNQLFISLRKQVSNINSTEATIQQMISNSQEIDITFDEKKVINIKSLGSLLESTQPCQVQYKPRKLQHAQIKTKPTNRIFGFEMDTELKLKTGVEYALRDLSITHDNKLLNTNKSSSEPKLYVYRHCKDYETEITFFYPPFGVAAIPEADRAIVTLPKEKFIQFINTKTVTKGDKVNVGFTCFGIHTGRDRISFGGEGGTVKTFDTNGTILKTIQQGLDIYFIAYDDIYDQLIVRCLDKLFCVKLDGTPVYSKDVSGTAGVTLDRQSNIYFGGYQTKKFRDCHQIEKTVKKF